LAQRQIGFGRSAQDHMSGYATYQELKPLQKVRCTFVE
jgi:hypothetical protein